MHLGDGPYILIQGGRWGRIFILDRNVPRPPKAG